MPTLGIRSRTATLGALTCLTLFAGGAAYTAIDYCGACSTEPIGVNNKGQISGTYFDADGNAHGFLKDAGAFVSFDIPDAAFFEAGHINNNGQIACDYVSADDGIDRPCVRNADGTMDLRPGYPGATVSYAVAVSDSGQVAGSYTLDPNASTGFTGFILVGKEYRQKFSYPDPKVMNTYVLDINNAGTVVGSYQTTTPGEEHGFLRTADGAFQRFDYPGAAQTELLGINAAGTIVGRYLDAQGVQHGFLLRGDRYTPIDYVNTKGAKSTYAWGINSNDEIVGYSFPGDPSAGPYSGFDAFATTAIAKPANFTTSQSQVQLDGSDSFGAGGKPVTWQWTLAPGSPNAIISNGSTATPVMQFFAGPGTYKFLLTVTDAAGRTATDTASVTYAYRR